MAFEYKDRAAFIFDPEWDIKVYTITRGLGHHVQGVFRMQWQGKIINFNTFSRAYDAVENGKNFKVMQWDISAIKMPAELPGQEEHIKRFIVEAIKCWHAGQKRPESLLIEFSDNVFKNPFNPGEEFLWDDKGLVIN